ncbi:hypothetical protein DYB25_005900 [Aphanomyces astaci]|uniref:Uncharacterized protein n=2 Tax=Aphanomyces astaci TaxID=112090 RepID=A0A397E6I5_APHAT|nr:hypothetical protein DYB36_000207 [Aphanomyces astaci]RHY13023.1 hypothetical protein DYB25_005900 [Aphanomyces astaci]RHY50103.1 hypothetical protein DYB34_004049 [Aphanomyces astaci]RHY58520.1 hypothetical protein DYB38_000861 [Aphanomyces astaci]RHY77294.1 hypothetical protein DYB30_006746 [Aphanomyces astaci]
MWRRLIKPSTSSAPELRKLAAPSRYFSGKAPDAAALQASKTQSIAPKKQIDVKKKKPRSPGKSKTAPLTAATTQPAIATGEASSSAMDPHVRDIAIYVAAATAVLMGAAGYKNYIEDHSLENDIFSQAKYFATRNKAVIDLTGLPTDIQKLVDPIAADDATEVHGTIVLGGVKCVPLDEHGKHVFTTFDLIQSNERLSLLVDNPRAPKTPEEEAEIKAQRQGELKELGSNLVLPVCTPIKQTNKNIYHGSITEHFAAFESKVAGPKGEGTMKVQALRAKTADAPWQFNQLSLDIQGRAKRVNLLDQERK